MRQLRVARQRMRVVQEVHWLRMRKRYIVVLLFTIWDQKSFVYVCPCFEQFFSRFYILSRCETVRRGVFVEMLFLRLV